MDLHTFEKQSHHLGTPIEAGNTLGILRGNAVALVGVDVRLARTDPKDYANGVRAGMGYFDIPNLKPALRPGLYSLWTRPAKVELGRSTGRIEARNQNGGCEYEFPARFNFNSLQVPDDAQGIVRLLASPAVLLEPDNEDDEWCIGIEVECDNGATFCIGFVFDPTPGPVPDDD